MRAAGIAAKGRILAEASHTVVENLKLVLQRLPGNLVELQTSVKKKRMESH
jgi:hypothetical protein